MTELAARHANVPESEHKLRDGSRHEENWPDEKVKPCAVSALARSNQLNYRARMTALIRSFVFLFIAIFVAGTFALSAAPLKAEASAAMAIMAMASVGQDCAKCDPYMDKTATCDLMCALSLPTILLGPVDQAVVLADCHFEIADVTANGRAPSPAFTPPRAIILI